MGFIIDLRYALRLLLKSPKFTLLTSLILMGGLSVGLMAFNFVYTVSMKPLDTPDGKSLVAVHITGDYNVDGISTRFLQNISPTELNKFYREFSYYSRENVRLSLGETGKNIFATWVSSNFLDLTRSKPASGRGFVLDDTKPGAHKVVLISYRLWNSLFLGNPETIGQTLAIKGEQYEIIGVMPKGYHFPSTADVWLPVASNYLTANTESALNIIGRLSNDISVEQANSWFTDFLYNQLKASMPDSQWQDFNGLKVRHLSLPEKNADGQGGILLVGLLSIALSILLLACINVGNLLFVRSIERQKETAIRAALGARQSRLIRQLICEGLIITILGGVLAVMLTGWLLHVIDLFMHTIAAENLPFWFSWKLDWQTIAVAVVFTLLTFTVACLAPANKASKMDINLVLRDGTQGSLGLRAGKATTVLITVQVALISILMLGGALAGKIIYSIGELQDAEKYVRQYEATFDLSAPDYKEVADKANFIKNQTQQLEQQTNIESASLLENQGPSRVTIDGYPDPAHIDVLLSSGQLTNSNLHILSGRDIDIRDDENNTQVVLVSQSFADRYWPGQSALNRFISIEMNDKREQFQIVGVVSDKGENTQGAFSEPSVYDEVYISYYQFPSDFPEITFKVTQEVDQGVEDFYQMQDLLNATGNLVDLLDKYKNASIMTNMLSFVSKTIVFAGVFSLFLALLGVYGVAANAVTMRRQEIGIRRAVGAKDKAIIVLFLKRNIRPLAVGLSVGLIVYTLCCFILVSLLGNTLGYYVAVALITTLLLSSILCVSAYIPTRRSVHLEPAVVLRAE